MISTCTEFSARALWSSRAFLLVHRDKQSLYLLPCPGCLSQEFQTGIHRRVAGETPDVDESTQLAPAIMSDQAFHDHLQGEAVEWVIGVFVSHELGSILLLGFRHHIYRTDFCGIIPAILRVLCNGKSDIPHLSPGSSITDVPGPQLTQGLRLSQRSPSCAWVRARSQKPPSAFWRRSRSFNRVRSRLTTARSSWSVRALSKSSL